MRIKFLFFFLAIELFALGGNTRIESFNKSKKELANIYKELKKKTIYCQADFEGKHITNLNGFVSKNKTYRDNRVEWEHIVPAEKFGVNFDEWKNGNTECKDNKENDLGNRDCAQKTNIEFRRMQSDMHNLFPSIGTVNILRLNYNFVDTLTNGDTFGKCKIRISSVTKEVEPPEYVKGTIGRTYLYMEKEYPTKMKLTFEEKIRFKKWNELYPPNNQECKRAELIKNIQGNENIFVEKACTNNSSSIKSKILNFIKH